MKDARKFMPCPIIQKTIGLRHENDLHVRALEGYAAFFGEVIMSLKIERTG
ncbi:hypothetical protein BBR47_33640 [Brevibacillus brevis NBRC 100599]|uniref:Uncharacterized protein n=1 Tax=Brevibacillus brevis (strain 47 / JCM 6285 / NBRC 100599) TaxID=358681 RepID=C0ZEY2_BREBN|nr:hypothetical protein BBR47_33640 [Brevibacillus brevis NBRC 100599]